MTNKAKIVLIIILVIVVGGLIVAASILLRPKGTVSFKIAPTSASLSINQAATQEVSNGQKLTLDPGTYSFVLSRDGFSTENQRVEVKKDQTVEVFLALTPKTDAAKKIIDDSPESKQILQQYLDKKKLAFFDTLPYTTSTYTITACQSLKNPTDKNAKAICINSEQPGADKAALSYITLAGYAPSDYELLIGTVDRYTIYQLSDYKIEYYTNIESNKPVLMVTPANQTASNEQLLAVRDGATKYLRDNGYNPDNYAFIYSNNFLSQFNTGTGQVATPHQSAP